jgi:hypothetical protein
MRLPHLLLFAGICLLPLVPQDPQPRPPAAAAKVEPSQLERLAWLTGTWVLREGDTVTEEHWRPLQGTTLLGTSHTYDPQRTRFFEFLRITAMHGKLAYIAMPGGAQPTVFPLTKLEDGLVEFENGKHDHPQRIRYEKTAAGITATISMLDSTRAKSFVFTRQ